MSGDTPFTLTRLHLNRSSLLGAQRIGGGNIFSRRTRNISDTNTHRNRPRLLGVNGSRVPRHHSWHSCAEDTHARKWNPDSTIPSCGTLHRAESEMYVGRRSLSEDTVCGHFESIPFSTDSPRRRGDCVDNESLSARSTTTTPSLHSEHIMSNSITATTAEAALPIAVAADAAAPLPNFPSGAAEGGAVTGAPENETFLAEYMPRGRFFVMSLLSTWGDENEVGMNGVEIFDENGDRIVPHPLMEPNREKNKEEDVKENIEEAQEDRVHRGGNTIRFEKTSSVPSVAQGVTTEGHTTQSYTEMHSAFHLLVEFPALSTNAAADSACSSDAIHSTDANDASVRYCATNLVNGVYNTHDESKLFLIPYSIHGHHLIGFVFPRPIAISMVRVYNYSGRGRVHTAKGVRLLEMSVDDCIVFRGEIAQSSGDILPPNRVGLDNCENILFTEAPHVLQRALNMSGSAQNEAFTKETETHTSETIGAKTVLYCAEREDAPLRMGNAQCDPFIVTNASIATTAESSNTDRNDNVPTRVVALPNDSARAERNSSDCVFGNCGFQCPTNVKSVCLMLLSTWGDTERIGLSGLRFRDACGDLVSHRIAHWYIGYPNAEKYGDSLDALTNHLAYLFDENTTTALLLPAEYGIQIIFVFETPLPTLGFIEVANFSLGVHTFCGVKDARLLLSSPPDPQSPRDSETLSTLIAAYATLWTPATRHTASPLPTQCGIIEVTPEEGVCLRKAPANLSIPRFQVYDLSLAAACEVSIETSHRRSLSMSLGASMKVRVAMALRRTRMSLKPRPEWLLEYQPYITPLLPVAYVLKVSLTLCATSVTSLKSYAKEWMLKPWRACTFADENGERISTRGDNSKSVGADRREGECSGSSTQIPSVTTESNTFVTEVLFTLLPNEYKTDKGTATAETTREKEKASASLHNSVSATSPLLLHAVVSLVYVADSPFCVSAVSLNRPLVAADCAAWVRRLCIAVDDALVFDSGDAGVPQMATQLSLRGVRKETHSTRLRPLVLFTLDGPILDEARRETDWGG